MKALTTLTTLTTILLVATTVSAQIGEDPREKIREQLAKISKGMKEVDTKLRETGSTQQAAGEMGRNVKRIEERRGWFRREAARYTGGILLYGENHRELIKQHDLMRTELMRLPEDASDHEVRAIVREYLPTKRYEKLLQGARQETKKLRQQLERLLSRGEWLWSRTQWRDVSSG